MADPTASVTTATCIVVLCADCGAEVWEDCEGVIHWDSLAAAVMALDAWDWLDPTRPVCPGCRVKRVCAADGHVWGEWRDCGCNGTIGDHAVNGCRRWRACTREVGHRECAAVQNGDRKAAHDV